MFGQIDSLRSGEDLGRELILTAVDGLLVGRLWHTVRLIAWWLCGAWLATGDLVLRHGRQVLVGGSLTCRLWCGLWAVGGLCGSRLGGLRAVLGLCRLWTVLGLCGLWAWWLRSACLCWLWLIDGTTCGLGIFLDGTTRRWWWQILVGGACRWWCGGPVGGLGGAHGWHGRVGGQREGLFGQVEDVTVLGQCGRWHAAADLRCIAAIGLQEKRGEEEAWLANVIYYIVCSVLGKVVS